MQGSRFRVRGIRLKIVGEALGLMMWTFGFRSVAQCGVLPFCDLHPQGVYCSVLLLGISLDTS